MHPFLVTREVIGESTWIPPKLWFLYSGILCFPSENHDLKNLSKHASDLHRKRRSPRGIPSEKTKNNGERVSRLHSTPPAPLRSLLAHLPGPHGHYCWHPIHVRSLSLLHTPPLPPAGTRGHSRHDRMRARAQSQNQSLETVSLEREGREEEWGGGSYQRHWR